MTVKSETTVRPVSKFALPKRVNQTVADEGKWVAYYSSVTDHSYGEFKIRSLDPYSKRVQAAQVEQAKKNALIDSKKLTQEEITLHNIREVVETTVADWRGVLDGEGNEIPFTMETAIEYFSEEDAREVFFFLWDFAREPRNYRDGLTKDDIAKN